MNHILIFKNKTSHINIKFILLTLLEYINNLINMLLINNLLSNTSKIHFPTYIMYAIFKPVNIVDSFSPPSEYLGNLCTVGKPMRNHNLIYIIIYTTVSFSVHINHINNIVLSVN